MQTEEENQNQNMSLEQKNELTASEIEQNKALTRSAFISSYDETNNIAQLAQKKILESLSEINVKFILL